MSKYRVIKNKTLKQLGQFPRKVHRLQKDKSMLENNCDTVVLHL